MRLASIRSRSVRRADAGTHNVPRESRPLFGTEETTLGGYKDEPIVIGGTGGSGTRVVVTILRRLGVFMGHTYDEREDSIPMGRFDRRWGRRLILHGGGDAEGGISDLIVRGVATPAFAHARTQQLKGYPGGRWGWKHPHCYLFLPFLHNVYPRMRFVHLVRNGLDMAISDNLGQLGRYGDLFVAPAERTGGEAVVAALFWARANLHARRTGLDLLADRYVCVRFEDLCEQPLATITELARRLEIPASAEDLDRAATLPRRPDSAGRAAILPSDLRAAMARSARPALEAFGYAE